MDFFMSYVLPFEVGPHFKGETSVEVRDRVTYLVAEFPIQTGDEDGVENAKSLAALFVEACHKKAGIA
jgi:hypothetical protein